MLPYLRKVLRTAEDDILHSFDPAAAEADDVMMLGDIRNVQD